MKKEVIVNEQTPGSESVEAVQNQDRELDTSTASAPLDSAVPITTSKTFTEDDLNRIVKDRLERERKKYADYSELKAAKLKLEELEKEKLTEEEKKKFDLEKLEKKIQEKEAELQKILLRERKRVAIDSAKLTLPKEITPQDLIDMIPGSSDEDIEAAIDKFKKMFPESRSLSSSSQTTQQPQPKPPDLSEQIADLERQAMDPKLSPMDRNRIQEKLLGLKLKRDGVIKVT